MTDINTLKLSPVQHQVKTALTDRELSKISALIYQRAGIVLSPQKRDMVYNRLSRRLRELRLASFTAYTDRLEADSHSDEWQVFINALTTNLTSFFREAYHFPLLAEHARQRGSSYNVWCTAASTGEEPCSIAMTLDAVLGRPLAGPRVWATDIDTEVLQRAQAGIYRLADIHSLTAEQKKRYLLRGTGINAQQVKIRQELLSQIHYQPLNLLSAQWEIPGPFDAIFCRNVMIYFDQPTQETLMRRFATLLKPGGLLFAGHSEHFNQLNGPFRLRGQSVYCLAGARG
ncbi:CheR family methyltransferase [Pantoea dispersa]|jgi:chemotaxis protein methyltransferase CheR|uniref:Chemotaxis protein methyltransferase n=1 Tax=Pantoea dispersa TaxID=59814 RepID=A0ABY3A5E5_9GAMM|nr:CheR family methyltransferase [Pantoea dispersa]KTS01386.1 chemotaxis protein CheR [Pantoea dispersa]MCT6588416.1 chemotaxis protein-glutamate O-methyltransferase [Pantoea dispersa]MCW0319839.1 Chemotaxis protein methyltransferase [Pantoea dispersa]MCW0324575.1 Chemotaxis protein methyltransferase [Pantoea dispersa]MCW0431697.1 Chemotaxis protein methyltransferase [Pantoea dispersa]